MHHTLTILLKSGRLHAAEGERVFCDRHGRRQCSVRTTFQGARRKADMTDFTFGNDALACDIDGMGR
jgi:hypothetical protein